MAATQTLHYFMRQVELRSGLTVSTSFPTTPKDEQNMVLLTINAALRYLNAKHYLIFQQTSYALTTTAGVRAYDLTQAPYSQSFYALDRLARNGVVRTNDDWPLKFIDYARLDYAKPSQGGGGPSQFYSQYGPNLLLYPIPDGEQYTVRYYSKHIGTDAAGTTQKLDLTAEDDITLLDDAYQDVLIAKATVDTLSRYKKDSRLEKAQMDWLEWEKILIDMANQPGEDANPALEIPPFQMRDNINEQQYHPFFTPWE